MTTYQWGDRILTLVVGDITQTAADAIVNAANTRLAPGGGVDGAIRRAGGSMITDETNKIGGCPTGSAVATAAGKLPARYVIHAVAPVWHGDHADLSLLESAYRSAMRVAGDLGVASIAFPSLGTGIYGNPIHLAAPVAVTTVGEELRASASLRTAIFVLFTSQDEAAYERAMASLEGEPE